MGGGCQTTPERIRAAECEKPDLRGDTWADVAILSVEQASAIDICNIRNGVDTYQRSFKAVDPNIVPVPTQQECLWLGVAVPIDAPVTGRIRIAKIVPRGKARLTCAASGIGQVVGCTNYVRKHTYDIYFEDVPWIRNHEACHAYYEIGGHTMDYLTTRD